MLRGRCVGLKSLDDVLYVIFEMHVREDRDFAARVAELQRVDKEFSCNAVANGTKAAFVVTLPHLFEGKNLIELKVAIQLCLGLYLEEVVVLTAIDSPANDEVIVVIAVDPVNVPSPKNLKCGKGSRLKLHPKSENCFPPVYFAGRDIVKCFSKRFAPFAIAANAMKVPSVWSENPTGTWYRSCSQPMHPSCTCSYGVG